ncbi:MAG: c-type cytochrome [Burkholderiales bacterium]|nr:c-type cytochrome [Burkholderiales bacterium]
MSASSSFRRRAALAAGTFAAATALGAAAASALVSGPGVALVNAKCGTCHDVTHITRSKLTQDEWTDNLRNMIQRGMPPPTDDERAIIIEYLVAYYGPKPPPPAAPDTYADRVAGLGGLGGDDPGAKLVGEAGCIACHKLDEAFVGPSFKAIAARYRGDSGAPARLAQKVRQGGAGVWGPTPMPPQNLTDAELKPLVDWVLAQK